MGKLLGADLKANTAFGGGIVINRCVVDPQRTATKPAAKNKAALGDQWHHQNAAGVIGQFPGVWVVVVKIIERCVGARINANRCVAANPVAACRKKGRSRHRAEHETASGKIVHLIACLLPDCLAGYYLPVLRQS